MTALRYARPFRRCRASFRYSRCALKINHASDKPPSIAMFLSMKTTITAPYLTPFSGGFFLGQCIYGTRPMICRTMRYSAARPSSATSAPHIIAAHHHQQFRSPMASMLFYLLRQDCLLIFCRLLCHTTLHQSDVANIGRIGGIQIGMIKHVGQDADLKLHAGCFDGGEAADAMSAASPFYPCRARSRSRSPSACRD